MIDMTDDETKEYDKSVNKLYKDTGINIDNLTKCERKAPKFIYRDIISLKNNDSISLFFIVLYF